MLIYMIKNFMHTKFAIQDLLSLQLHNLNSEDKSSFKELRDFFMQAPVPLAILKGPEHFFTLSNTDYEKLIGRSAMGKNLLEVFSKDELDESLDILNHVYKTGIPFIGKELILNLNDKDGVVQQKWIDVAYHPFRENNEDEIKGIFAVFQDVTDRVIAKENITKNEAALKQAIELLELERDIREKLISALSHDMRTPLAAAKLSAQILTRKRPDEATILRVSNRIAKNMDRADRMIQDILDASHIKAGERVALEIASFDLKELMEVTIEDLINIHGPRIILKGSKDINGYWDSSVLKRMTENLVNNAVKYGHELGTITIELNQIEKNIEIAVHNIGNPIPIEEQQLIFEPSQRSASATTGSQKGWGIGLTLVRGFAEALGGRISLKSSEHEGTTFSIFIPLDARSFNDSKCC